LSQHFLSDRRLLGRIAEALEARPGETVLEIGPGPGGLTAELARLPVRLVAIERDRELVPALRSRFPAATIVEGDALALDWHALVGPGPFRIVGNIPYHITSPLLERALRPPRPLSVVFLVQKEVALRLVAQAATAEYGALSVGIQAVARAERLFTIPAGAFFPPPRVDSAVIRLVPLGTPLVDDPEVEPFRRFVVGIFGFRRKQLARALRQLTGQSPEAVAKWLAQLGLSPTVRPDTLTPDQLVVLFRSLRQ
jgi:16S rRNA (adenine1518-N6/adenine1519-N6)-dimethyltransferase